MLPINVEIQKPISSKNINFGTVSIIFVENVLESMSKAKKIVALHGMPIEQYVEQFEYDNDNKNYAIFVNGEEKTIEYVVKAGDFVVVIPYVGKGFREIVGLVAVLAIAWYAPQIGQQLAGGLFKTVAGTVVAQGLAGHLLVAGITAVGALLVNEILGPEVPQPSIDRIQNESKQYSWTGVTTNRGTNHPIPILYGTFHLGGTQINKRITQVNGDDWLEVQIALCHGEIDEITEDDIFINNQLWKNITNLGSEVDAEWGYTNGAFDQPVVSQFGAINSINSSIRHILVPNEEYRFFSESRSMDSFELTIAAEKGLFERTQQGALKRKDVIIQAAYRKVGDTEFTDILGFEPQYEIEYEWRYWSVSFGEADDQYVYEWSVNRPRFNFPWERTGRSRSTGRIIGDSGQRSKNIRIRGASSNQVKRMLVSEGKLEQGQYEFKITRLTPQENSEDLFNQSELTVQFLNERNNTPLNYGGIATFWFRMKATEHISREPNIIVKTTRSNVKYRGNKVAATNPAYVINDLAQNKNYGGGYANERINFDEIDELATFCTTNNLTFNGVYDTETNLWTAMQDAAKIARSSVIYKGNILSVVTEKQSTVVQLVNASTKSRGKTTRTYIDATELATQIEVNFADETLKNTMQQVVIVDEQLFKSRDFPKKVTLSPKGVVTKEQAAIYGQRYLASNKFKRRVVVFREDVKSIDFGLGDVVAYQDNIPRWGVGGRISSVNGNVLTLSAPITMVAGKTYNLKIQNNIDEIVSVELTGNQTTSTVTIPDASNVVQGSYFIFVNVDDIFLVKITDIKRESDNKAQITAIEYNESILNNNFNDDILRFINPPDLPRNLIENVSIEDGLVYDRNGQIATELNFSWDNSIQSEVSIYAVPQGVEPNAENRIEIAIRTLFTSHKHIAIDLFDGETYDFYFRDINNNVKLTYTIQGKLAKPTQIENVQASSGRGTLIVTWNPNEDLDLNYYIITINGQEYTSNAPTITLQDQPTGIYRIAVQAVDTSKIRSNPAELEHEILKPSFSQQIQDADLIRKAFVDGKITVYFNAFNDSPTNVENYDIWKIPMSDVPLEDLSYNDFENMTWNDFNSNFTYQYYLNTNWILCTEAQIGVIEEMLAYVTPAATADNNVRIFSKQPFPPYSVGDLWIRNNEILECNTERLS